MKGKGLKALLSPQSSNQSTDTLREKLTATFFHTTPMEEQQVSPIKLDVTVVGSSQLRSSDLHSEILRMAAYLQHNKFLGSVSFRSAACISWPTLSKKSKTISNRLKKAKSKSKSKEDCSS